MDPQAEALVAKVQAGQISLKDLVLEAIAVAYRQGYKDGYNRGLEENRLVNQIWAPSQDPAEPFYQPPLDEEET